MTSVASSLVSASPDVHALLATRPGMTQQHSYFFDTNNDDANDKTSCDDAIPSIEDDETNDENVAIAQRATFSFLKGRGADGSPYITVSKEVAKAAVLFPGRAGRRRNAAHCHFKGSAVLGALVAQDARVLKLATSVNDVGPGTDRQLLYKPIWRKRIKRFAAQVKLKLGSFTDGNGKAGSGRLEDNVGEYNASHVEKKLSIFALYVMLRYFGIRTGRYATVNDVRKLRERLRQSARPGDLKLEILVSRHWCSSCKAFVTRLSRASGLDITMRVQPVVEVLPGAVSQDYKPNPDEHTGTEDTGTDASADVDDVFEDWELAMPSKQMNGSVPCGIPDNGSEATLEEEDEDDGTSDSLHDEHGEEEEEATVTSDSTPPPPSPETIAQFAKGIQSFSHELRVARAAHARGLLISSTREPLFKRKPLPPTPVMSEPLTYGFSS